MTQNNIEEVLSCFDQIIKDGKLEAFGEYVVLSFKKNSRLSNGHIPIIHSIKSRIKNREHLREKIIRKQNEKEITKENLLKTVTDLYGIRILLLHQKQFADIHQEILKSVETGEWRLGEMPTAYSWDPETTDFFKKLEIETKLKDSYYTSVHYLIKPSHEQSPYCVEVQVRTLLEEVWGEIDHAINYPKPTSNEICKNQIKVLAKLVAAGSRLADSIFESHRIATEQDRTPKQPRIKAKSSKTKSSV